MMCIKRIVIVLLLSCCQLFTQLLAQSYDAPNIIFIIADDLNDYVEGYDSNPDLHTPNINILRNNGTTFLNAIAPAPLCAPSRTAILTGKDLNYTQVYKNGDHEYVCYNFDGNFTEAKGNAFHITMPQYFKDTLGYYTYNLNKIFHCHTNYLGYDEDTEDPCAKTGMWNNYFVYDDSVIIDPLGASFNQGVNGYDWAAIPDSMEKYMSDVVVTDSAVAFIDRFSTSPEQMCNKPFLMMLGYAKPHKKQYIPEHYFPEEYVAYVNGEFDIPYNFPNNAYPVNGIIMPPQPVVPFSDVDAFPPNSVSRTMVKKVDTAFMKFADDVDPLPQILDGLTEEERRDIITWSMRANAEMAYMAAVNLVDAQVGRLMATLQSHPEVMENTIVVLMGDHGYSLGQKRHWGKYAMWDVDLRTTFIVADLRDPASRYVREPVNLIDIFPSLLDMMGAPMPTFPDGSDYFDGVSITPLMSAEEVEWERPILSAVKKLDEDDLDGSCYPQYSVRNQRFHLIRYQTNGGGFNNCIPDLSTYEYELYEIGENRDVDPYEWNNFADSASFLPVKNYLLQWLPEGTMYLKRGYDLKMQLPSACIVNLADGLEASIQMKDSLGSIIDAPEGFVYQWSNNVNGDLYFGASVDIDLNGWSSDIAAHDGVFYLYIQMIDPNNGTIVGFDMQKIFTDAGAIPSGDFTTTIYNGNTVYISDVEIGDNAEAWWWDFGAGPVYRNQVPGPYTYQTIGDHHISLFVQYGNTDNCVVEISRTINTEEELIPENNIFIFPNPVAETLHVITGTGYYSQFTIYDISGRPVANIVSNFGESVHNIDISALPAGMYCLMAGSGEGAQSKTFVVIHP